MLSTDCCWNKDNHQYSVDKTSLQTTTFSELKSKEMCSDMCGEFGL